MPIPVRVLPRAVLVGALLLRVPPLAAQVVTVDEGSFTVSRGGATIGREEFRILRQPAGGGSELVARALAAYGDRRIAPTLRTDADGRPLGYRLEVRAGRTVTERLSGEATRGHFASQLQRGGGESSREYLVADGTVVVDDELFHQLWFVMLRPRVGGAATVPILAPRRDANGAATVREAGRERLAIGGAMLDAVRLDVAEQSGRRWTVWMDGGGRLLRVALPADGIVAQRDDPPR